MSDEKLEDVGYKIITGLDNAPEKKERGTKVDVKSALNQDIYGFFSSLFSDLSNRATNKQRVEDSLMQELDSDNLDFEQKMRLHKSLSTDQNITLENFLGLFKPAPGTQSPLLQSMVEQDEKDATEKYDTSFKDMTPEERALIEEFTRAVREMEKNGVLGQHLSQEAKPSEGDSNS